MTQGYPLSPTIFNVVVEVVVRHYIPLVAGGVGGQGRVGKAGDTLRHHFLRGLWPGHINGAGLVAGII